MPSGGSHQSHGLHTPHELTWLGKMRLALRRQNRALYRAIRHPRNRRRSRLRAWLAEKIRNRSLWRPTRNAVAAGLAGGLFFAMLPIPLQSFIVLAVGMARGWNLPAAVLATWLSNPFTYLPMLVGAKYSITGLCAIFGHDCAAGQLSMDGLSQIWHSAAGLHFGEAWHMAGPAVYQIILGMVILGVLCAVAGWVLVHLSWSFLQKTPASAAAENR